MYPVKETGIPTPRRNEPKYPWEKLTRPGLSFDVPVNDIGFHTIRNTARARQGKVEQRYSCRLLRDEKSKTVLAMRITRLR